MPSDVSTANLSLQAFWDYAISRGFFPLAIAPGSKAPIGEGWNRWTAPLPHPGAAGIGFRCGDNGLSGFDVDNARPQIAAALLAAFRKVLGDKVPVRWGRRPRFLIPFYLIDAPVTGRTFKFPDGEKLQLIGGQFVAFGPHKDTGVPYEWENLESEFPRITTEQLQYILSEVPKLAGTSLQFGAEHEEADETELREAVPQNEAEWRAGRDAAVKYLGMLKQELLGKDEGRGSTIFAIVGILKFAEMHGMCTREEIQNAVLEAGHGLHEKRGGRELGEEIARHDQLPVLRGNLIMGAIMSVRTLHLSAQTAMLAPTMVARTGLELSLVDSNEELPWIIYQRIMAAEIHFFTGHAGAGKSTVASDMLWHYLTGRPWLEADIERSDGHILWIAAEDDYGTERRMKWLLRQEPNGDQLANRFHLVRGMPNPLGFEIQCTSQVQFMASMGMRVDFIILDTWGSSGLCFADNDTDAVLKAMFTLKQIAQKTQAAVIITDHLPLGNEDAWHKGNGAKHGNAGFMYRVTTGKKDQISIDCGKARGAPKARSYIGKVASEIYGKDQKGRDTTVNVFRRELIIPEAAREQTAEMKLAAMLPAAQRGMDALHNGFFVHSESVAAELGGMYKNDMPPYTVTVAGAEKNFGSDLAYLLKTGLVFKLKNMYFGVRLPTGLASQSITLAAFQTFAAPVRGLPWEK